MWTDYLNADAQESGQGFAIHPNQGGENTYLSPQQQQPTNIGFRNRPRDADPIFAIHHAQPDTIYDQSQVAPLRTCVSPIMAKRLRGIMPVPGSCGTYILPSSRNRGASGRNKPVEK